MDLRYAIVAVNLKTHAERVADDKEGKGYDRENAEAVLKLFVFRHGVETEFFKIKEMP